MTVSAPVALVPLAEAQAEVLAACPTRAARPTPVEDVLGCAAALQLRAPLAMPPFANTSLDGYAVRAADVAGARPDRPVPLAVLGSVPAGAVATAPVGAGQAWKIMTGAPLPDGADAIVMVEHTSALRGDPAAVAGAVVSIFAAVRPGEGVRAAGSNIRVGDVLVEAGDVLTAARAGMLAGAGLRTVPVVPRLRVGVLVTGDELVAEQRPLRPGEIYEANGVLVAGLLRESGFAPVPLGIARDDPAALADRFTAAAADLDAVITTGGVSMGDADPVKLALAQLGRLRLMRLAIRPAKPFAFGVLAGPGGAVPVFGLPGNPVSSLVSFELLARPALRQLAGFRQLHRPRVPAIADGELVALGTDGRTNYTRVVTGFGPDGRVHARPVGKQESHQLAASADADGFAIVAPGTRIAPGESVEVILLRG